MQTNLENRVKQLEENLATAQDLLSRFAAFVTLVLENTNDTGESAAETEFPVPG